VQIFKGFGISFNSDDEKGLVHYTFSTDDVDSYGDVVVQEGWVLDRYTKNPIILWGHDHRTPAIGIAQDVSKSPHLNGNIKFAPTEIHSFAGIVAGLVKNGFIKAGSVGFQPLEYEPIEERNGQHTYITGYRFTKQELFEFSICNVPANPFCLTDFSFEPKEEKTVVLEQPPYGGLSIFCQGAT
jgi:HK97 family phage prohead protease